MVGIVQAVDLGGDVGFELVGILAPVVDFGVCVVEVAEVAGGHGVVGLAELV